MIATLQLGQAGRAGARATPPVTTYATWNPSDKGTNATLSNANLTATSNATASVRATIGKSAGKWYWEVVSSANGGALVGVGLATAALINGTHSFPGGDANGRALYFGNGDKYVNNAAAAYASNVANGVVVGVRLDMDAGTLAFSVGGVDKGTAFTGLAGTFFPMFGGGSSGTADNCTANFGATAFTYSVPAGFNAGMHT